MDACHGGRLHVSLRRLSWARYISIKVLAAGKQFARHVVPAVIKPLRVLWNEMIAFVFMAFGVMVAFSTWRKFSGDGDGSGNFFVLAAGGFFALILFFYGVSSILRARKIARS